MNDNNSQVAWHYQKNIAKWGISQEALGWTRGRHRNRFNALTRGISFEGKSILDVGCGFGSLLDHLHEIKEVNYQYTGIDIVPEFIHAARDRWGDSRDVQFKCLNFNDLAGSVQKFDWVICNGTFSLENGLMSQSVPEYLNSVFSASFALAKCGVAISFVTDRVEWRDSITLYVDPVVALCEALKVCPAVSITTAAFKYEFFIQLFR